jgi:hypothetical protein
MKDNLWTLARVVDLHGPSDGRDVQKLEVS